MKFYGINSYLIEQYISFKRNLGYAISNTYTFKMFDEFTIEQKATSIGLTKELAIKWAEKRQNESNVNQYRRVNTIINFSIYLNQLGYQSYIPKRIKNYQSTFTPYIFSREELRAFFIACDLIEVKRASPMKYILPIIFRLIYGCGLRESEAVNLKKNDVDLENGFIIIRETKNGSDRKLPMSDSLTIICNQYKKKYLSVQQIPSVYFFPKKDGRAFSPSTLYGWFRKILWNAGIPHGGKGKGPRLHDLRHTFSVHSLVEMSHKGLDLYYSLPILSKYLGHKSLETTDKYVRLTSEMYPELIQDVNSICSFVFPEVSLP